MFHSTRLRLTAVYLVIIMAICTLFSVIIFSGINLELNRFERLQKMRQFTESQAGVRIIELPRTSNNFRRFIAPPPPENDPEIVANARLRIIGILVILNLFILGIAGLASYILAGITLKPIKKMIDEQHRFVTDASHELRTPLTALRSEIEVHLRDKSLNLRTAKRLLESNLEEVKNLQQLSEGLIKLTQYQKNQNTPLLVPVSSLAIINDAVKKVQSLAKQKKITITAQLEDTFVNADPNSLCELFVILLDNAIKYSPKNTPITIVSNTTDHQLKVKVTDHGYGINKEDLPYIFDRFYRADKSRTQSETQGYGLGLSIAKQIIESHHGAIEFESTINVGTVITVTLPISQT